MIKGTGIDIIEIDRIRKTIEKHGAHFYTKLFTEKEIAYCIGYNDPAPIIAGRFAAKEAIAKALGTGFGKALSWLDIEIENDEAGAPHCTFSDPLIKAFDSPKIHLSISHCSTHATAIAIRS